MGRSAPPRGQSVRYYRHRVGPRCSLVGNACRVASCRRGDTSVRPSARLGWATGAGAHPPSPSPSRATTASRRAGGCPHRPGRAPPGARTRWPPSRPATRPGPRRSGINRDRKRPGVASIRPRGYGAGRPRAPRGWRAGPDHGERGGPHDPPLGLVPRPPPRVTRPGTTRGRAGHRTAGRPARPGCCRGPGAPPDRRRNCGPRRPPG
jgi:hypothetical protein